MPDEKNLLCYKTFIKVHRGRFSNYISFLKCVLSLLEKITPNFIDDDRYCILLYSRMTDNERKFLKWHSQMDKKLDTLMDKSGYKQYIENNY